MTEPLKKVYFKKDNGIAFDAYRLVRMEGITELNIARQQHFFLGDMVFLCEIESLMKEYDPNQVQFILEI